MCLLYVCSLFIDSPSLLFFQIIFPPHRACPSAIHTTNLRNWDNTSKHIQWLRFICISLTSTPGFTTAHMRDSGLFLFQRHCFDVQNFITGFNRPDKWSHGSAFFSLETKAKSTVWMENQPKYFDRQSIAIFDMELRLIHHFIKHNFEVDLVSPFHPRVFECFLIWYFWTLKLNAAIESIFFSLDLNRSWILFENFHKSIDWTEKGINWHFIARESFYRWMLNGSIGIWCRIQHTNCSFVYAFIQLKCVHFEFMSIGKF